MSALRYPGIALRPSIGIIWFVGIAALNASAADWQATASGGFGKYHYVSLQAPGISGEAGVGARYVLDAAIGRAVGGHLSIEGAWTFQDGDFEIKSGSQKTAFDAHAHAFHGDLYYYWRSRAARVRPFIDAGAGVKLYQGIETVRPRPLAALGSFAHEIDARTLLLFGGGVEIGVLKHWAIRAAIRDFTTPFPSSVIVPAPGGSPGGWLHDFVITAGIQIR